ncbi:MULTISPECIES: biotin--[acetyl-CoA-carboxylase] ligase [unclassified Aureispira]|uniref:biotin--[acetyl-CoA-carboxylase] ligase n=1 Tax=unclassified Aureispira TaxID=2649989 RepID=UPI0007C7BD3E|nr:MULTISPECIES: biotin--[acetyl-CoA-carboxylase] ligase [unclassified Aureispira]WMX15861.1 biotin--[acetyl-CoA-carboxylase] ligase [Aureispira sp. CCB-E]
MKPVSSNSLFIGKVANYLASVDSTNIFANTLLAKSTPIEGTVIYTDNQYAGRGQIGSKWESAKGENITLSVILYPKFLPIQSQFKLNQVVALAVYDLLKNYIVPLDELSVKWPNDIYINDKKIGGILIENKLKGHVLASTIIGVGLNINQTYFSPELPNPTSLFLETNIRQDTYQLIGLFCEYLEQRYLQLKAEQHDLLNQDYLQTLYAYQEWRTYQDAKTKATFQGKIVGISPEGRLQIQTNQQIVAYSFKEVVFM